jgi:hypothetical protein
MTSEQNIFQIILAGKISRGTDSKLQIIGQVVGSTKSNSVVEELTLPARDLDDIEDMIAQIRGFVESGTPVLKPKAFEDMGSKLFGLVFKGKIRIHFERAYGANHAWLPCQFICDDPVLATWPWEYCYDEATSRFLCRESSPVARGLACLADSASDTVSGSFRKVRLLLALGVPADDPNITPQDEIRNLHNAFETYLAQGAVEIQVVELDSAATIDQVLDQKPCDIFHYFGHAGFKLDEQKGYLKVRRSGTEGFEIEAEVLGQSLAQRGIRLVFLNACKAAQGSAKVDPARSAVAGALLARGIPVVVGTQFRMPDLGSHFFSSLFYNGLVSGRTIIQSLHSARRAMLSAKEHKFYDWGIPAVYTADPSMKMFPAANGDGATWRTITDRVLTSTASSEVLAQQALPEAPSIVIS